MKVVVCAKTVGQLNDEVGFTDDGRDVLPGAIDSAANEWDLAAAEEALQLRDAVDGEVVVVTCGSNTESEKAMRRCLAMGADRGIRVKAAAADPLSVAHALASIVRREAPDLVLCGVQSADAVQAATGSMVAALAGLPSVAVVRRLEYDHLNRRAVVDRELEGGIVARMEVDTPALITIQTGATRPRYANLRAIKQAERAEVEVQEAPDALVRAYVVRKMFVPDASGRAERLVGDPATIAMRLKVIVEEQLK